jgi:hypothetical protein
MANFYAAYLNGPNTFLLVMTVRIRIGVKTMPIHNTGKTGVVDPDPNFKKAFVPS